MLFCHVTSQVQTDKHDQLLSQKGGTGFPYLAFLDAEGNVLAKHMGMREVAGFSATAKTAAAFVDLKKKAENGDKAAKSELLVQQLELGHLSADDARAKMKDVALSAEQKAKVEALLANAEVQDVLKTVTQDKATRVAAGKKFLELKKAGKPAPAGEREFQSYWIFIMDAAEADKDARTFEEAYEALKKKYGPNMSPQFTKMTEDRLAKLKEAGK